MHNNAVLSCFCDPDPGMPENCTHPGLSVLSALPLQHTACSSKGVLSVMILVNNPPGNNFKIMQIREKQEIIVSLEN